VTRTERVAARRAARWMAGSGKLAAMIGQAAWVRDEGKVASYTSKVAAAIIAREGRKGR
jgi:hypothetical protein